MSRPRVSLGLPVYNGERFLAEALDCALSQTFGDFELLIADNGSTDRTEEISRDYAARDPRVTYHPSPEDRGAAWNFNRTVELASAPYFKWMAHDDRFAPAFLERCVEVLDRDPGVVLVHSAVQIIDARGAPFRSIRFELHGDAHSPHERFRYQACVDHWCFHVFGLIRSRALRQTRLIGTYVASDRVLLAHLSLLGRIHELPEELFFQRRHDDRSTHAHPSLHERAGWFDPARAGKLVFPSWRLLSEYTRCILESPIGARERLLCAVQLARWIKRYTSDLGADLRFALAWIARGGRTATTRRASE